MSISLEERRIDSMIELWFSKREVLSLMLWRFRLPVRGERIAPIWNPTTNWLSQVNSFGTFVITHRCIFEIVKLEKSKYYWSIKNEPKEISPGIVSTTSWYDCSTTFINVSFCYEETLVLFGWSSHDVLFSNSARDTRYILNYTYVLPTTSQRNGRDYSTRARGETQTNSSHDVIHNSSRNNGAENNLEQSRSIVSW